MAVALASACALLLAVLAPASASASETPPTITEPTAFQTVPSPVSVSGTAELIDSVTLDVWEGNSASGSPAGGQSVLNVGSWSTQLTLPPGTYTIVAVANGTEETRSEPVTFTVPAPETAPEVTSNPSNRTVTEGESASFSASATGNPTPTAEWEYSTDGGSSWKDTGSGGDTFQIASTTTSENGWKFRAMFTNSAGKEHSASAELRVNELQIPPEVTANPQGQTVTAGESASFFASASGTPAPSVEWQVSTNGGSNWSSAGGSSDTFETGPTNTSESGRLYRAVFHNSAGKATSAAAELRVEAVQFAPMLESSPSNRTVKAGESASFSASASGNPTPSIEWQVSTNGGGSWSAAGGSGNTFNTGPTNTGENGYEYRAVFSNSKGSTTSGVATLEVLQGPEITGSPANVKVEAGQPASFTASAAGSPAPSVQWQVSGDGGGSWASISGANSTTFTIASTTPGENNNQYRAVFHNASGNATSAPARLEVLYAPSLTGNPSSRVVTEPESVSFSATAVGNPGPGVQWQVSEDEGKTWANDTEPSATSPTLKIAATNVEQSGNQYRAVFTNGVGSPAVSGVAVLTVHERKVGPTVTEQPENQIVKEGETAVFRSAATGVPFPSIQWEVSTNGGVSWGPDSDPDAKSTTLVLASVPASHNNYRYRATFSNGVGAPVHSNEAKLTVSEKTEAPHIEASPANVEVQEGLPASFTAKAGGIPTPTVQWEVSSNHGANWAPVSGATFPKLTIAAVKPAENENEYRAVFTNKIGLPATSGIAKLTVLSPPKLTLGPTVAVAEHEEAVFTATATGVPAPTIQWEYAPPGSGSFKTAGSGPEFTIPNVTEALNGYQIKAVAKNGVGTPAEAVAILEVTNSPTVKVNPGNVVANAGSPAQFTASASGSPVPNQVEWEVKAPGAPTWSHDTADKAATSTEATKVTSTLTVANASSADNGNEYRAQFKRSGASPAISEPGRLTVHLGPAITSQPSSVTVAPGAQASFSAAASGLPAPTVQWEVSTDGGATFAPIEGASTDTLTIPVVTSADDGHSYRAVFSNGVGEPAVSAPALLTVSSPAAPAGLAASFTWSPRVPGVGEPTSLTSTSTDPASGITGYAWDLGGTGKFTAGGSTIGTVFTTPGLHHVGLRVTAADGHTATVSETIEVLPAEYPLMRPFPVVRIAGVANAIGAKITLLGVQAPIGAKISVACKGHGCPAKTAVAMASAPAHHHGNTVTITFRRFERQLRAGIVLKVRVSKSGVVGKYTSFTIRRSKSPLRVDACLDALSAKAIKCPI